MTASSALISESRATMDYWQDRAWAEGNPPRLLRLAWLARARHCRRLGMQLSAADCRRMAQKYR